MFDSGSVHVRSVVERVSLKQSFSSSYCVFPSCHFAASARRFSVLKIVHTGSVAY